MPYIVIYGKLWQIRELEIDKLAAACEEQGFLFDRDTLVCCNPETQNEVVAPRAAERSTFVDLFCSCGGLTLGMMEAGLECGIFRVVQFNLYALVLWGLHSEWCQRE